MSNISFDIQLVNIEAVNQEVSIEITDQMNNLVEIMYQEAPQVAAIVPGSSPETIQLSSNLVMTYEGSLI